MAVLTPERAERPWRGADHVYVTHKAREQLASSQIWYHLGGWSEDGDTYETQEYLFGEELELFWSDIIGPGEYMRAKIVGNLDSIKGEWQTITIDAHRTVVIMYKNGSQKTLKSPFAEDSKA